jgi:uncharacterized protein YraI
MTTSQIYLRGEPSTASAPLGMIGPNTKVQILGRDPSGNWVQILYTQGPNGKGWLTAQYVTVNDMDSLPVIGSVSGSGPSGVIIQQVNVRTGPGTDSDTVGMLNPRDIVTLTGKDPNGVWLQIEFAKGPQGRGWVNAAYVQASSADALPIVGGAGKVLGTGTPTGVPSTVTPTIIAAPQDHDSAQAPAVNIIFSPLGARSLIYSSDLSSPRGDPDDWIQFTPFSSNMITRLTCLGNGRLNVDLLQAGNSVQNWGSLACGETTQLILTPELPYTLRLSAVSSGSELVSVNYTISVETVP